MKQYFLSIRAFLTLTAVMAIVLVAGGCGEDSAADANGGEVTVKTGSLSKAEFIKRADAICKASREKFTREYVAFVGKGKPLEKSRSEQEAFLVELVETILLPNFGNDIEEISAIGAPNGDEQEIAGFLTAFQRRLDAIHETPLILEKTAFPFTKPAKLAKSYGLVGCAESLS